MTQKRNWLITIAQLGLAASWLMAGAVYVFTPPRMAAALGILPQARISLGVAMFVSAVIAAVGAIAPSKQTSILGVALLAIIGASFTAYYAFRHFALFTAYDGAIVLVAVLLIVNHVRDG